MENIKKIQIKILGMKYTEWKLQQIRHNRRNGQ